MKGWRDGEPAHPSIPSSPHPSPLRRELARKGLHILSAAVPVGYAAGLPRAAIVWLLAALAAVAVVVELGRARSVAVRTAFLRTVDVLLREHERERWSGATWLLLAFLGAVALLPRAPAVAATWAASMGDASAALVGRWIGAHRVRGSGKSLEGSAACFLVTLAGAALVAGLAPGAALAAAACATAAEWPARPLDDNVRIVAGTAGGILLWQFVFLDKFPL